MRPVHHYHPEDVCRGANRVTAEALRLRVLVPVVGTLAALMFSASDIVASWMTDWMPLAWRVTSAGSQYPALGEAMPTILRGMAIVLAIGLVAETLHRTVSWRPSASAGAHWHAIALGVLSSLAAVLHGFLARPHNAFPSNSRLHWVEIWFDRRDDFFYPLLKVPHYLFYDGPWLLMAMNAAVNVLLIAAIVRRNTQRPWAGVAAAATYLVSAQMLLFANSAEDVQLSITALLLVVWAHGRRQPVAMGGALFVAMLARPSFLLIVPAFVVAELLSNRHEGRVPLERPAAVMRDQYVVVSLALFTGLFLAWHGWLGIQGDGWLLADGQVIKRGHFGLEPREIDGFSISSFSGAYLGHLLWLYPAPLLLASAVVVGRWRRLSPTASGTAGLIIAFAVATLLLLEGFPLMYFNIRYIAYMYPLLIVLAWMFPLSLPQPRLVGAGTAFVVVVLILSGAAAPHRELDIRDQILTDPLTGLFPQRQQLRVELAGEPVYVSVGRLQRRNVVAYLIRRPLDDLRPVEEAEEIGTSGWLITDDPDLLPHVEPLAEFRTARVLPLPD